MIYTRYSSFSCSNIRKNTLCFFPGPLPGKFIHQPTRFFKNNVNAFKNLFPVCALLNFIRSPCFYQILLRFQSIYLFLLKYYYCAIVIVATVVDIFTQSFPLCPCWVTCYQLLSLLFPYIEIKIK